MQSRLRIDCQKRLLEGDDMWGESCWGKGISQVKREQACKADHCNRGMWFQDGGTTEWEMPGV